MYFHVGISCVRFMALFIQKGLIFVSMRSLFSAIYGFFHPERFDLSVAVSVFDYFVFWFFYFFCTTKKVQPLWVFCVLLTFPSMFVYFWFVFFTFLYLAFCVFVPFRFLGFLPLRSLCFSIFISITKGVTFLFIFVSFVFLTIFLLRRYVFSCRYLLRLIIFGCS
ncbi:hypothetical protein JHK87_035144 [Glycine soja]|nr:hypothetical protein JHK87_035144 [Glycine soja]